MASVAADGAAAFRRAAKRGAELGVRKRDRPRVVVLGTGWGSYAFARKLDPALFDTTVVSPRNHMLFTPLLASTSVGTLEFRSIAQPVRPTLPGVAFEQGKCRGIDPDAKILTVKSHVGELKSGSDEVVAPKLKFTQHLPYDMLVIGVGGRANTFNIEGVDKHVHFLKELADARAIRRSIIRNVEVASFPGLSENEKRKRLSFAVVGGGPTGVEFASELYDFIREDVKRLYPDVAEHISVHLVVGGGVLGTFDRSLRDWAISRLKRSGVNLIDDHVVGVQENEITLASGKRLPFGVCVWSTGIAPRRTINALDPCVFLKNKSGKLRTDGWLRVLCPAGTPIDDLFALGDCAAVGDELGFPATAQVAEQQGEYLAKCLTELVREKKVPIRDVAPPGEPGGVPTVKAAKPDPYLDLPKFKYNHRGSLAYLGAYGAVSDFTEVPNEGGGKLVSGKTMRGLVSWMLWRSAYLTKLGTWRNRIQVPFDWMRAFIFGRDTSNF